MAALIERIGPVKLRPRHLHPFQSLTPHKVVVHQQEAIMVSGLISCLFSRSKVEQCDFGHFAVASSDAELAATPASGDNRSRWD